MLLWQRINRIVFGTKPNEDTEVENAKRSFLMVDKTSIQLAVYQFPYEGGPAAQARYTNYGEDGKLLSVEQVTYHDNGPSLKEFDDQVTAALEMGMDVTILTKYEISLFPKIQALTEHC